jgi:uncharacterized protein YjbI with pentapeptide repeats
MDRIARKNVFVNTGEIKRERENFQGYAFNDIDLRSLPTPLSFYRSDFRATTITNCVFDSNNFKNADFIDASINKTQFLSCDFQYTELYNSLFNDVIFYGGKFSNASLVKLVFINSMITGIRFSVNTVRECKFTGCLIEECNFSKSSLDEVTFIDCKFKNVDLSSMTGINMYFENCVFNDVIIDADYFGSYFFKGNEMPQNLKLKYRGRILKLDIHQTELIANLSKICWERGRYYEALNLLIQRNLMEDKITSVHELVSKIMHTVLSDPNTLKGFYQIDKIIRVFEYYFNTGFIPASDYFRLINDLDSIDKTSWSLEDQLRVTEKTFRIRTMLDISSYSQNFLENKGGEKLMLLEVTIDEEDQDLFELSFDKMVSSVLVGKQKEQPYSIVNIRKGSLIYDIVLYSSVGLLLLKIIRRAIKELRAISNEGMQFRIDYNCNKSIIKQLKKPASIDKVKKIKEVQVLSEQALASQNIGTYKEVNDLLPLLKNITMKPNEVVNG